MSCSVFTVAASDQPLSTAML